MKLIYDIDSKADVHVVNEMNEATGQEQKKYKIKGIFSTIGEKNRNGRVYPKNIWESEIAKYQEVIKLGSKNTLMEWEHPPRTDVDMMESVQKITSLKIEGKYVMGEQVLLDNPKANQIKSLIENGIKISVSSRGVGSVKNGIVENFKLVTYDLVSDPSDYNQTMNGVMESQPQYSLTEGILESKTFDVDASGKIYEVTETKKINQNVEAAHPEGCQCDACLLTEEEPHVEGCQCKECLQKAEQELEEEIKNKVKKLKALKQKSGEENEDEDEDEVPSTTDAADNQGEQDDSLDETSLKDLKELTAKEKEKFLECFSSKLKDILV